MAKFHQCTDSKTPTNKQVLQPKDTVNIFITFATYAGNLNSPHFRTLHIWWRIQLVFGGNLKDHMEIFLEEEENMQS